MLRWICHSCNDGHHRGCWGTQHPPKGYMGGATCVCDDKTHKEPGFITIKDELAGRKAVGKEMV